MMIINIIIIINVIIINIIINFIINISIVIGRRRLLLLTCMSETHTRPRLHLAREVEADFSKS